MTTNGEIYIWSSLVDCSLHKAIYNSNLRSERIVDLHCVFNHAVAVSEKGDVYFFMLSEAFESHGGHISTAAQRGPIESLMGLNIQKAHLLPMGRCDQYCCKCCIVALTDMGIHT